MKTTNQIIFFLAILMTAAASSARMNTHLHSPRLGDRFSAFAIDYIARPDSVEEAIWDLSECEIVPGKITGFIDSFPECPDSWAATPETGWQFKLHDEGCYDDCELSVARTTDEDGNVTLTFTDFAGQTVLSRRVLDGAYLDTYYVYDDAGNLTAVIPPMGVESMVGTGDEWDPETGYPLCDWAYFYAYDYLHRVVKKQLPGCDPVEYRYRGTATVPYMWQDANMREKGVWRFTVPDIFGRTCLEGTCSGFTPDPYNREGHVLARMAVEPTDSAQWCGYYIDGGTFADMKVTKARYYGSRDAISFFRDAYKQRTGRELFPDLGYIPQLPMPLPDGSVINPISDCKGREALTVTSCPADSGDIYLLSLLMYDPMGRLGSVRATNHIGGTDRIDYSYDFAGRITGEKLTHSSPRLSKTLTVRKAHTYDRAGRRLTTSLSVNGQVPVTIVSNTYDDTGRLVSTGPDSPWKATTFFDYNIRSWPVTVYADSYMQELDFTPGGNVKAMRWRAEGDTAVRRYDFAYDGLGRLTSARYGVGTGAEGNYDTDYTYDAHGNLLTLQRKGLHDGGRFALIDDLFCTYDGNRLVQVNDAATPPTYKDAHHFVDTRNWSVSGGDYSYDRCGNMVNDRNRGLTYRYDLNHQPCAIGTRGLTKRLRYTDDGVKLHEHYDYPPYFAEPSLPGSSDVTDCLDYCGDVTYRDGHLHSLDFEGGYLTFAADSVSGYHYYVADHLGNVRAVVSDADSVEQVNHYYPFGILMGESRGSDVQRRKFGGKELDREWGLDLFDFEARRFDGMRFTQPDPLAELSMGESPYAYCHNNPLLYIDPDGNVPIETIWDVGNVCLGGSNFVQNLSQGNYTDALIDAGGMIVDLTAAVIPYVPGGASTAIKSYRASKAVVNLSKTSKKVSGTATINRQASIVKGVPESQIGPSGKPKIHNVKKANNKKAKEAARHQPGANTKPLKHSSDKGQKTHYHSTRNGKKRHGKYNVHYIDNSSKTNHR